METGGELREPPRSRGLCCCEQLPGNTNRPPSRFASDMGLTCRSRSRHVDFAFQHGHAHVFFHQSQSQLLQAAGSGELPTYMEQTQFDTVSRKAAHFSAM